LKNDAHAGDIAAHLAEGTTHQGFHVEVPPNTLLPSLLLTCANPRICIRKFLFGVPRG
jgi:hypothetical protein